MISTPTVLVLGAGASYPYGFPTAAELKVAICSAFSNPDTAASRLIAGDHSKHTRSEIFAFREAFLRSGQPSIDAFLERRSEFLELGKLAIAYCLMPFEDESMLYRDFRGGNWYEHLAVKLNSSFTEFAQNKLSIITFNYDRSLEHYLFNALQHFHGKSPEECAKRLRKIPIIHVYGQLGRTAYPDAESLPYEPHRNNVARIERAAAGITLLHESKPDLKEAHRLLAAAHRICILGFGYHELNLKRLWLSRPAYNQRPVLEHSRVCHATAKGLIGDEITHAHNTTYEALLLQSLQLEDADNLEVLRRHRILD
jgi:hypothetical protein